MLVWRNQLAFMLLVLSFSGCAVSEHIQEGSEMHSISSAPSWVLNSDKPGYISVVGSAPRQDWGGHSAQYRVAEMKARQELAQMVRVRVESENRYSTEVRAGSIVGSADTETSLRSNAELSLDSARVIEEWTNPDSGELYIWLVLPD